MIRGIPGQQQSERQRGTSPEVDKEVQLPVGSDESNTGIDLVFVLFFQTKGSHDLLQTSLVGVP